MFLITDWKPMKTVHTASVLLDKTRFENCYLETTANQNVRHKLNLQDIGYGIKLLCRLVQSSKRGQPEVSDTCNTTTIKSHQ